MKRRHAFVVALFVMVLTSGCRRTIPVLSSEVRAGPNLTRIETIYMVKHAGDRDIHRKIASGLEARGKRPVLGAEGDVPAEMDALLTYEDRWAWDFKSYLILLKVDLRDPRTNVLLATASSNRLMLDGSSPDQMVAEVLEAIFAGPAAQSKEAQ